MYIKIHVQGIAWCKVKVDVIIISPYNRGYIKYIISQGDIDPLYKYTSTMYISLPDYPDKP